MCFDCLDDAPPDGTKVSCAVRPFAVLVIEAQRESLGVGLLRASLWLQRCPVQKDVLHRLSSLRVRNWVMLRKLALFVVGLALAALWGFIVYLVVGFTLRRALLNIAG